MTSSAAVVTTTTTTTRTPEPGPLRWWLLVLGALITLTLLTWGFAWSVERATTDATKQALADAGLTQVTVSDVSYRDVTLTGPADAEAAAVSAVDALGLSADVRYVVAGSGDAGAGAEPTAPQASATPAPATPASATPAWQTAAATPSPSVTPSAPAPSASAAPVVLPDLPDLAGVQFETSSATLTAASLPVLDQAAAAIVAAIQTRPALTVAIQGHTDAAGDAAANLTLSQQRADAVLAYLVGKGVPAGALSATGFGETQPIADNSTDAGRALNRRVVFVISEG